jgi:hypothetical protein
VRCGPNDGLSVALGPLRKRRNPSHPSVDEWILSAGALAKAVTIIDMAERKVWDKLGTSSVE